QTGVVLGGCWSRAFDGLAQTFEAADAVGHFAREFFQHITEMLEIAADKELRLFGGDIESLVGGIDRVPDLFHLRFKTGDRFTDGRKQTGAINLRSLQSPDQSVFYRPPMEP